MISDEDVSRYCEALRAADDYANHNASSNRIKIRTKTEKEIAWTGSSDHYGKPMNDLIDMRVKHTKEYYKKVFEKTQQDLDRELSWLDEDRESYRASEEIGKKYTDALKTLNRLRDSSDAKKGSLVLRKAAGNYGGFKPNYQGLDGCSPKLRRAVISLYVQHPHGWERTGNKTVFIKWTKEQGIYEEMRTQPGLCKDLLGFELAPKAKSSKK